ncbi:hypothetical protein BDV93DRAFT_520305 [Ceratobasidium sp. AG-I]|nr:hypothetical protein BDV93DRAFT_520305 [Ceratobasidium sp. AG-I]
MAAFAPATNPALHINDLLFSEPVLATVPGDYSNLSWASDFQGLLDGEPIGSSDILSDVNTASSSTTEDNTANPDSQWEAVLNRTPNSSFVYCVISTKIYCRTTCPSRRPLRSNVVFYRTCAEAENAGYRPCKRCKPDDAAGEAAEQRQAAAVQRAKELIEERSIKGGKILLDRLASEAGLSTFYFHRVFKRRVGVTPEQWGKRCREQQRSSKALA